MVQCCAPSRDLVWNPRSLPQKDLPTGIAEFKLPEPGFQGSPRLVGRRTKLARRTHPIPSTPRGSPSLAEAKLAEDGVQQIVDGGLAHHLTQST